MKKIILILPILIVAIVIAIFMIIKEPAKTDKTELSPINECKTIAFNGDDKTNIVFFSNKNDAERYSSELLNTPPFDEKKGQFNFFYIEHKPECKIYKNSAVFCYNKELIKKSSVCPNDFIVVISDEKERIRSSAYMNVISINSKNSMPVISHEFGHVFANLADEYIPSIVPKKSQNCKRDCTEFVAGKGDECFKGCAKAELYRSIDWGLMRTLSTKDYGEFDKKIINQEIERRAAITGMAPQETRNCLQEEYYLIHAQYENGQINLIEKTIENGCIGTNGNGAFNYNLILEDKSIVDQGEFNPELIFTDSSGADGEEIDGDVTEYSGEFFLKIPVIPNAEKLEILKEQEKIIEINLKEINSIPCKT